MFPSLPFSSVGFSKADGDQYGEQAGILDGLLT